MPLIVSNIKIGIEEPEETAFCIAKKRLRVSDGKIKKIFLYKKSLDARKKEKILFVVSVVVELFEGESEAVKAASDPFIAYKPKETFALTPGMKPLDNPVVIIGFGPAGIFAAHLLAQYGYAPIILERGACIKERAHRVSRFWETGDLDEDTNVQFGEGGAGTFSDGKLMTRISDRRCDRILETLIRHGAPKELTAQAKPHIGTDLLRNVIASMRREIIEMGGEIFFDSRVDRIHVQNGRVVGVTAGEREIRTNTVILAVGHSARDTFSMLFETGIAMEPKGFSVGVRIEQPQSVIDRGLYGDLAGHKNLPPGEYQLSHKENGRCVYTFCMCPGGVVVPASSSRGGVVTNGMSNHARNGANANAALVVSVDQHDFTSHPLGGVAFQEDLEKRAFVLGGRSYRAPATTVSGFLNGKPSLSSAQVTPSYALGVKAADFSDLFPREIIAMLHAGLQGFGRKLPGFSDPDGFLTGPETRTSSPVRILREKDTLQSVSAQGLYPCGEGAGYAGGIMSAAADGLRIAEKIISSFAPAD